MDVLMEDLQIQRTEGDGGCRSAVETTNLEQVKVDDIRDLEDEMLMDDLEVEIDGTQS